LSQVKEVQSETSEDGDFSERVRNFYNDIFESIKIKRNYATINSAQEESLRRLIDDYGLTYDDDGFKGKGEAALNRLFLEHILNSIPNNDELSNELIKQSEEIKEAINEINPVVYRYENSEKPVKASAINKIIDKAVFSYLSENAYENLAEEEYEVLKERLGHYFTPTRENKEKIIELIKEG